MRFLTFLCHYSVLYISPARELSSLLPPFLFQRMPKAEPYGDSCAVTIRLEYVLVYATLVDNSTLLNLLIAKSSGNVN